MLKAGAGSVVLALLWLSRLPVGRLLPQPAPSLASSLWAFPLAGAILGAIVAAVYLIAAFFLPAVLAAIVAIGFGIWITGGLHEDGLADFADGMGGRDAVARLQIMRDSRIGSYGALTLGLVTALRIAALAALPVWAGAAALFALGAATRSGMVVALYLLPPARSDGLGRGAGVPSAGAVVTAVVIGLIALATMWLCGFWPFVALTASIAAIVAAQLWVGSQAQRRLGGHTGDVLGAIQQAGEAVAFVALVATAG